MRQVQNALSRQERLLRRECRRRGVRAGEERRSDRRESPERRLLLANPSSHGQFSDPKDPQGQVSNASLNRGIRRPLQKRRSAKQAFWLRFQTQRRSAFSTTGDRPSWEANRGATEDRELLGSFASAFDLKTWAEDGRGGQGRIAGSSEPPLGRSLSSDLALRNRVRVDLHRHDREAPDLFNFGKNRNGRQRRGVGSSFQSDLPSSADGTCDRQETAGVRREAGQRGRDTNLETNSSEC